MASFWGDPGTSRVIQTPGTPSMRPPGFQFAQWLFRQLPALMNTPFPTYQGQLDPGLSPTMQDTIRRAQGYAQSSPPEILAGINGSLGRFMSPSFVNPWNSLWRGGATPSASPAVPRPSGSGGWSHIGMPDANGNRAATGPALASPWNAGRPELFGGSNNYFQVDPNQTVWGGGTAGDMTWQGAAGAREPFPWGG